MWKRFAAAGFVLAIPAAPLTAQGLDLTIRQSTPEQSSEKITVEEALQRNQAIYGPPPPRRACKQNPENTEIVVCAEEEQDQSQFRVQSSAQLDPTGREGTNDGVPRAPDVAGEGIFKGKPTITFGSPAPPAIIFDISALPEAPEGSDADRIARGQKKAE